MSMVFLGFASLLMISLYGSSSLNWASISSPKFVPAQSESLLHTELELSPMNPLQGRTCRCQPRLNFCLDTALVSVSDC